MVILRLLLALLVVLIATGCSTTGIRKFSVGGVEIWADHITLNGDGKHCLYDSPSDLLVACVDSNVPILELQENKWKPITK